MSGPVVALYADGGILPLRPLRQTRGLWAWCAVGHDDRHVARAAGVLDPLADRAMDNNITEFVAAVLALETVPPGWEGTFYSDSRVTLRRLFEGKPLRQIPADWVLRAHQASRKLGPRFRWVWVAGHPRNQDLVRGRSSDGNPVSAHQVWCDQACKDVARAERAFYRYHPPGGSPMGNASAPQTTPFSDAQCACCGTGWDPVLYHGPACRCDAIPLCFRCGRCLGHCTCDQATPDGVTRRSLGAAESR